MTLTMKYDVFISYFSNVIAVNHGRNSKDHVRAVSAF